VYKINLFDETFRNSLNVYDFDSCSDGVKPTKFQWVRDQTTFDDENGLGINITVFTDHYIGNSIVDVVDCDVKIAWLIEPRCIHPWTYQLIESFEHKFDFIFTHDSELLKKGGKYVRMIIGSSRVPPKEQKIYEKPELLSIIASNKVQSVGHRLRHDAIKTLQTVKNIPDTFGTGYTKFFSKMEPLRDYAFSIAIMNDKTPNFFTEVLVDCFMVGAIPIFWGCPNIGEWFDERGIITFDTIDELKTIVDSLSFEKYKEMLVYAEKNFSLAKKFVSTDDIFVETFIDAWRNRESVKDNA